MYMPGKIDVAPCSAPTKYKANRQSNPANTAQGKISSTGIIAGFAEGPTLAIVMVGLLGIVRPCESMTLGPGLTLQRRDRAGIAPASVPTSFEDWAIRTRCQQH